MSYRWLLVAFALALTFVLPNGAHAQNKDTISGSVGSVATNNLAAPVNLVVVLYRDAVEIGRYDAPLPAGSNNYPFQFTVDQAKVGPGGGLTLRAYIVDRQRRIHYESDSVAYTLSTSPTISLAAKPGTINLPRASAGTLLLLGGALALVLAGVVALWRRRRYARLVRRLA